MKQFIDRKEELDTLQREYEREDSSLVIMYGRRRVGKTTLISEFIKDKKALFFLVSEEREAVNRDEFKNRVAQFIDNELLAHASVTSWDIIFKELMSTSFDSKPIIVIDEFQYLGKSNPAFPSIFQRIWDTILKDKSVMVILCGSLISMMTSQTLSYSSPLYGRRTAQINLKQVPFKHYSEFYSNNTKMELIEKYAVTGGIPKYIESFENCKNIYDGIANQILNKSSYLYDEPTFLLQMEVRDIGSYFSIIKAIAMGNTKISSMSSALEIKATSLTKYLETLIDLDIIEREVPITEENPLKSKKGVYKIKDNYLKFWFTFIYPHLSYLESGHMEFVLEKIKQHFTDNQVAFVYEDICRDKMWELNMEEKWPFHFLKVGRYWDSSTEIDVVALDPEGNNLIVGECKYWKGKVGLNILNELEQKAKVINWKKKERKVWFVLFSINGFSNELLEEVKMRADVLLIS